MRFPPCGAMGRESSGTKLKGSAPSVGAQNISANACIVAHIVERPACKYKPNLLELVEIVGGIYTRLLESKISSLTENYP